MLFLTAIALTASVSVAQPGCSQAFPRCFQDIALFNSTTCTPLQANHTELYNDCLCFASVAFLNCYFECDKSSPQYIGGAPAANATALSTCQAAGLDPSHLPGIAPWQKYFPTTTGGSTPTGVPKSPDSTTSAYAPDASSYRPVSDGKQTAGPDVLLLSSFVGLAFSAIMSTIF